MELLAPAGSKEALIAAVENGADSVYLGGAKFGARAFANNFSQEELLWAIEYCHMHNVKVYVTVNTLVHQHEIEEAMEFLWFLYTAGVDAVIVQDLGLASLAKDILPELVIHASTQMTIHNPNDLKLLEELNIKRVVLARELSLAEIKRMAKQTSIELEVFAHGALCFSYSGQCLFSSIVGGRSGNRGKCAQPCRLQYQLLNQDLNTKIPTQGGYLLSTKDLNVVTQLKELKESGVSCLKIEGRMKRPEYVALVTKTYRTALNTGEIDHLTLEKVFNRGYTTGFISGKHQRTLSLTSPTNQGFEVGQVVSRKKNHVFIKLKHKVNEGDGLELTDASGKSIGVIVSGDNFLPDMMLKLYIKTGIKVGSAVYLTSDRELLATAQQTYLSVEDAKKDAILYATLRLGDPIRLRLEDREGVVVESSGKVPAQKASVHPLTKEDLKEKLLRFGNSPLNIVDLKIDLEPGLIIPISEVNRTRRALVEEYQNRLRTANLITIVTREEYQERKDNEFRKQFSKPTEEEVVSRPLVAVSVTDYHVGQKAIDSGVDIVYFFGDLYNKKRYHDPMKELSELTTYGRATKAQVFAAFDRITTAMEQEGIKRIIRDHLYDGVLVSNLGTLSVVNSVLSNPIPIHSEWSLNIFNSVAVRFLEEQGVSCVTVSPELNLREIRRLANFSNIGLAAVVHGPLELMVSEHCILRGLGKCSGENRLCETALALEDRKGYRFPLKFDRECRLHLFNSVDVEMDDKIDELASAGITLFRIEARTKDLNWVESTVSLYKGKASVPEKKRGTFTRGHFYRGVE